MKLSMHYDNFILRSIFINNQVPEFVLDSDMRKNNNKNEHFCKFAGSFKK